MLVWVVDPPAPLIDLADIKAHLQIEHSDDDAALTSLIAAASARFDGPASTGRPIGEQELCFAPACLPPLGLPLPTPHFIALVGISYRTTLGSEDSIAADQCRFAPSGSVDGRLEPFARWPSDVAPSSILVTYRAGLDDGHPLRECAKQGVRLLVKHWYDSPGDKGLIPASVEALRSELRVRRF